MSAGRPLRLLSGIGLVWIAVTLMGVILTAPSAGATPHVNPLSPEFGMQHLVYGASTPSDVQRAQGRPADQIVRAEIGYPVIENYYYFAPKGTGDASVFVFENGLLVGLFYQSPNRQLLDVTSFLMNNGDRLLNLPMLGGHSGFYPDVPYYFDW